MAQPAGSPTSSASDASASSASTCSPPLTPPAWHVRVGGWARERASRRACVCACLGVACARWSALHARVAPPLPRATADMRAPRVGQHRERQERVHRLWPPLPPHCCQPGVGEMVSGGGANVHVSVEETLASEARVAGMGNGVRGGRARSQDMSSYPGERSAPPPCLPRHKEGAHRQGTLLERYAHRVRLQALQAAAAHPSCVPILALPPEEFTEYFWLRATRCRCCHEVEGGGGCKHYHAPRKVLACTAE